MKKIFDLLNSREKKQLTGLSLLILMMSGLDALGVASVMPLMTIVTSNSYLENGSYLTQIKNYLQVSHDDFNIIVITVCISIIIFSIIFKAGTNYLLFKYTNRRECSIGQRLLEGYLGEDYLYLLSRNSSEMSKNILAEVTAVIGNGLLPIVMIFTHSVLIVSIFVVLFAIDSRVALTIFAAFVILFCFAYVTSRKYIKKLSKERLKTNKDRFFIVNQIFGSIKAIKFSGFESLFVNKFKETAFNYSNVLTNSQLVSMAPRYAIEVAAFGGLIIFFIMTKYSKAEFISILPILSVYIFAAYRMMPSFQMIFQSTTQLRIAEELIDELHKDVINHKKKVYKSPTAQFNLQSKVILENISYIYPNKENAAIDNISILIEKGKKYAFIGPSGGGKTTLIDIFLGLLKAQSGSIYIDETKIDDDDLVNLRKIIGYVPQAITLIDDCLASNIAFGVAKDKIDHALVSKLIELCDLEKLVLDQKAGPGDNIGEQGVKLSGGQRQRIGIARALYTKPDILIMDESTSALDYVTEAKILENIKGYFSDITWVTVAHRLDTVKGYDCIYVIDSGRVESFGDYAFLRKCSNFLRKAEAK